MAAIFLKGDIVRSELPQKAFRDGDAVKSELARKHIPGWQYS